jgi:hypothetical protein
MDQFLPIGQQSGESGHGPRRIGVSLSDKLLPSGGDANPH